VEVNACFWAVWAFGLMHDYGVSYAYRSSEMEKKEFLDPDDPVL
jgi:hypothetical protein